MIFADWFNDFLGHACFVFVVVVLVWGWVLSLIAKAAKNAAKEALNNEEVREGIKLGLWWSRLNNWWR